MRMVLLLLIMVGALLATVAEPLRPSATIELPAPVVGGGAAITVTAHDLGLEFDKAS